MSSDKRSLVLHYDEENDQIVFFSVPASEALALRKDSGSEIPLSEFRAVSPDEAERRVGEGVFHMFDCFAVRKTGIRDYAGNFEKDIEAMIAELEAKPTDGDGQILSDLSVLYRDLAMRRKSWDLMKKSEVLTRTAAAAGVESAVHALENWELLENAFKRRIDGA